MYPVRVGQVRFQLEFGELLEVSGVLYIPGTKDYRLSIPALEGEVYAMLLKKEHIHFPNGSGSG